MALINARSIRNMLEFQAMVSTFHPDIIVITETWVDTVGRDLEEEFHLPGFTLFHQDRAERAGGGVMLYVERSSTPVSLPITTPFEIEGADAHGSRRAIRFVVCYRPPRHPLDADLALYETLSGLLRGKASVLAGDFNCPGVDWNRDLAVGEGLRLVDFKLDNFLSSYVGVEFILTGILLFIVIYLFL